MSGLSLRATSSSGGASRKKQGSGSAADGRYLSKEEIVSITGTEDLGSLKELEVLFVHLEDIDAGRSGSSDDCGSALSLCRSLTRLAMIGNGLKRLSPGLQSLGRTLSSLCICDQEIAVITYLDLPVLRELYLHRNCISDMGGLVGCPRLRKLWLSQNMISRVMGLEDLPELEELMLHGNQLVSLRGIEASRGSLQVLGLAGNMIADYEEMYRLSSLTKLKSLALQDVHFGLNPIALGQAYKSFCMVYMSATLELLDGVAVTRESRAIARENMKAQINSYADVARLVEENVRQEIAGIAARQQAALSHVSVLEKEMVEALRELEALVAESRASINKQVRRQKRVMENSRKALETRIGEALTETLSKISMTTGGPIASSDDVIEASFCVLERSLSAEAEIVEVLARCVVATQKGVLMPIDQGAVSPRGGRKSKAPLMSPTSPTYEDDFVEESADFGNSPFLTATGKAMVKTSSSGKATWGSDDTSKFVFVYQPLLETSPDFLRLSSLFADYDSMPSTPVLLRAFRTGLFVHHSLSGSSASQRDAGTSALSRNVQDASSSDRAPQYCYAVVAATENQLQQILVPGEIVGSATNGPSILLFSDLRLALQLHCAPAEVGDTGDGNAAGGGGDYSCFANDAAIRKSLLRHLESADGSKSGGAKRGPKHSCFRSSIDAAMMAVVCCRLDTTIFKQLQTQSQGASSPPGAVDLKMPSSSAGRADLLRSLRESQRCAVYCIDGAGSSVSGIKGGASTSASSIYVVPVSVLAPPMTTSASHSAVPSSNSASCVAGSAAVARSSPSKTSVAASSVPTVETQGPRMLLHPDFVCICLSTTIDGVIAPEGGIKALEHKLELLLTPPIAPRDETDATNARGKSNRDPGSPSKKIDAGSSSERNDLFANQALVDFNALVARELRAYVDRIAEDVASAEAEAELVSGHAEAEGRADAIRALKRQIVEERRAQEALLKRLKEPNQGGATSNANAARPRPAPLSARR